MSALIILSGGKRTRLKMVAKSRKVSVTKLIEEMATILLADFDAETRFEFARRAGVGESRRGSRCWTKRRENEPARSEPENIARCAISSAPLPATVLEVQFGLQVELQLIFRFAFHDCNLKSCLGEICWPYRASSGSLGPRRSVPSGLI